MNGTIVLYTDKKERKRTAFYFNKEDRKRIIDRWRDLYGPPFEKWFYKIVPYINPLDPVLVGKKVTHTLINSRMKDIEMEDFVKDKGMIHETYWHRCYYKGEK
jgi:hypothetical protein